MTSFTILLEFVMLAYVFPVFSRQQYEHALNAWHNQQDNDPQNTMVDDFLCLMRYIELQKRNNNPDGFNHDRHNFR